MPLSDENIQLISRVCGEISPVSLRGDFTILDALIEATRAEERAKAEGEVEKRAPVQGFTPGIPWSMHLRAYDAYRAKWGEQKALIDLEGRNCRGGFGTKELDMFIPGWRDELSELAALKSNLAKAEARIAELEPKAAELDKIAEDCGEATDPFAAWETIDLWRTQASQAEELVREVVGVLEPFAGAAKRAHPDHKTAFVFAADLRAAAALSAKLKAAPLQGDA